MLLLLDSGSTHSFISANFAAHIQAATVLIPAVPVKLANGDFVQCDQMVSQLEWHCQGYKFSTDLRILQLGVYDGVLGMDWLEGQGNMNCNWKGKAISFHHLGDWITLQGILPDKVKPLEQVDVHSLNILHANNEIWAMVVVDNLIPGSATSSQPVPTVITSILTEYAYVFAEPKELPPHRHSSV
jgi:hypothetical protein